MAANEPTGIPAFDNARTDRKPLSFDEWAAANIEIDHLYLSLPPFPEFTRNGWGAKVTALGGEFNECRGETPHRYVELPPTPEGIALAEELVIAMKPEWDGYNVPLHLPMRGHGWHYVQKDLVPGDAIAPLVERAFRINKKSAVANVAYTEYLTSIRVHNEVAVLLRRVDALNETGWIRARGEAFELHHTSGGGRVSVSIDFLEALVDRVTNSVRTRADWRPERPITPDDCPVCGGDGLRAISPGPCPVCHGTGRRT